MYALSWHRPEWAAQRLGKPVGRAVSPYKSADYKSVKETADYINSMCPQMSCDVQAYR
jgi:hypothetical protein